MQLKNAVKNYEEEIIKSEVGKSFIQANKIMGLGNQASSASYFTQYTQ